jgi:hypothetical protein
LQLKTARALTENIAHVVQFGIAINRFVVESYPNAPRKTAKFASQDVSVKQGIQEMATNALKTVHCIHNNKILLIKAKKLNKN